jgi:DNA-binding ferritin-like protein
MDDQARKLIAKYIEDMHSLVSHGLQPIRRQLGESQMNDHPEARAAVQEFETVLQRHVDTLGQRLESVGTSPTTAVQDAAAAVAGIVAGFYNQVRSEAASKSIRDDYTFFSHCAVSWLMLATTAKSLGDHDTEELAEEGYRDVARLIMRIDDLMPTLVVQELQQDKLAAQNVTDWARRIVSGAWQRAAAGSATAGQR